MLPARVWETTRSPVVAATAVDVPTRVWVASRAPVVAEVAALVLASVCETASAPVVAATPDEEPSKTCTASAVMTRTQSSWPALFVPGCVGAEGVPSDSGVWPMVSVGSHHSATSLVPSSDRSTVMEPRLFGKYMTARAPFGVYEHEA